MTDLALTFSDNLDPDDVNPPEVLDPLVGFDWADDATDTTGGDA